MTDSLRFAHLSDWHATSLAGAEWSRFRGKRLSGWASWAWSRRQHHSEAVLDAAMRDVASQAVDCTLVTGDLTHVSLPSEFRAAAGQLERLGPPERVFLVPGNHDCYVEVEAAEGWDRWAPYLRTGAVPEALAERVAPPATDGRAPTRADYPTLRVFGPMAAIGLCSAVPMPIFRAGGVLGDAQLERLEGLLEACEAQGLARVVMLHHPVVEGVEGARRALRDGAALREVLARAGAELVLHGHKHRRRVHFVEGKRGRTPVVGVPSSSEVGSRPDRLAQYHVYTLARDDAANRFRIEAEIRSYAPDRGGFEAVDERLLLDRDG